MGGRFLEVFDFFPEFLQVPIFERHPYHFVFAAKDERAFEPNEGGVQLFHLAGVAGKVVADKIFAGKFIERRKQSMPGAFDAAA